MATEPEITTMSEKGQVVIPQAIRRRLGLEPRTKFVVFAEGDVVVLKKLSLADLRKDWEALFAIADAKPPISEEEIQAEIEAARRERRGRRRKG